ncbi:MAG: hypothetical protein F6K21_36385, partial [Symploca sp. SIO2D2]|nr:hypothetical protein [Symploca sp. SIO2D2]
MPKTKKRPRTTKEIGKLINKRYKILRHLSAGGQGIIYLVQDEQSNYPSFYAIKQSRQDHKNSKFWTTIDTIFNSLTQEATDITFNRSTQEAAILRDLTQDGVSQIPCYENYFKLKQEYYLVQEFIQGKTIKEILHTVKNFNEFQIIAFLQDVLNILIRLHSYYVTSNNQAMYHRDIKPSNLMWQEDKGHIVIVDFGITKYRGFVDLKNEEIRQIRTKRKRLSQNYHLFQQRQYDQMTETEDEDETGIMVTGGVEFCGTPPYAAPESWVGNVYPSSDIYSLGVTAIEALTGQAPSDTLTGQNPNVDSTINKYDRELISNELADILEKMIDSKYQERYQSAQEVLDELEPLNAVGNVLKQRYRIVKVINYLNQESFYTETINHTYIAIDTRAFSQQVIIREFSPQSQDIEVLQEARHILDTECQKLEEINRLNIAIPRLLDYFSEDSKFYVVYEIIEGRYLSQDVFFNQELKQNWGEQQVIQFLKEILVTLDSMHNCDSLHLDIKPSKILTTDQSTVY